MNLNKFIQFAWSIMAARNRFWGAVRSSERLSIREFSVLSNEVADSQKFESARKVLTLMFANLKKRGRPANLCEEDRNVA